MSAAGDTALATIASKSVDDAFKRGTLDRAVHKRLVDDIDRIAGDAGVAPKWIWTPLGKVCSQAEVDWVRRYRFHEHEGRSGLVLTGNLVDVEQHVAAICGALTRNFIRARVMTVSQVLGEIDDGGVSATCLLVPNLFTGKKAGGVLPDWQVSKLYDLLLERRLAGQQTVLGVTSLKELGSAFGELFLAYVESNYVAV